MKNLVAYVQTKNRWNALFNRAPWDLSNPKDFQDIFQSLDCDLSPENLTCDGELRGQALQTKTAHLKGAMAELRALAERNGVFLKEYGYDY